MESYKNIGVYGIVRKHHKGDEKTYRTLATEPFYYKRKPEWTNFTEYVDEANVGTVCDRANLRQLINDAACEKIDHIFICSLWDFWHNSQMLKETMDMLNNLPTPVGITFPKGKTRFCTNMINSLNEDGYNRILYEMLKVQCMDNDFMFLAANFENISKNIKTAIFQDHINQERLYDYFVNYEIMPTGKDWEDLQKEIGLYEGDLIEIKEMGYPYEDGVERIIEWGMREIIAHYLI